MHALPRRALVDCRVGVLALILLASPAAAGTHVYTTSADFDSGTLFNVHHDVPDQLQLGATPEAHPFLWVACSARGTVAKIDTRTGRVLAEYLTAPENIADRGGGRNPSRTTVTRAGSCWVGNRNSSLVTGLVGEDGRAFTGEDGSVAKYGLLEAGQCVDRNGNGVIDTSRGLGDVKPWPNPADVDSLGGISSAQDECILIFKRIDGPWVRQVSVDSRDNIWAGGNANVTTPPEVGPHEFTLQLLDGESGDILRTIDFQEPADTGESAPLFPGQSGAPYGGLADCRDVVWSAGYETQDLLRIDPAFPNGHPSLMRVIDVGEWSYGLAIAPDGTIWHSTYSFNTLWRLDADGNVLSGPHPTTSGNARGVCVTRADSHAWVANTNGLAVTRHSPDGSIVAVIPVDSAPTGLSVDSAGRVWVTCINEGTAQRIDPSVNAVDLSVELDLPGHPFGEAAGPYNYSDMTGQQALSVLPRGEWSIRVSAECPRAAWTSIAWTAAEPRGTHLRVEARAAETSAALLAQPWTRVANGAPTGLSGAELEARVAFIVDAGACANPESPILFDLSVTDSDVEAPLVECPGDVVIECGEQPPPGDASASDNCGVATIEVSEREAAADCPARSVLERTFTARDAAGNESSCVQRVTSIDTTPPELHALGPVGCLWPPNHRYVCFTDLASLVAAVDACPGELSVRAIGCASDQPEDQQGPLDRGINGDGNTDDDCVVADDGSGFCVRSERLGQCESGRTYGVTVEAVDACGNAARVVLGLHVPHDQREHPRCLPLSPHDVLLPHEPPPFAWTPNPAPDAGLPEPFACP